MTVMEVVNVLKYADRISIVSGCSRVVDYFDKDDELLVDAFGNYIVKEIYSSSHGTTDKQYYELRIAMNPVKNT